MSLLHTVKCYPFSLLATCFYLFPRFALIPNLALNTPGSQVLSEVLRHCFLLKALTLQLGLQGK